MSISLKANAAGTQGEVLLNGTPVQTFNQNWMVIPLLNYADDAAAAAAGVPVGGLYRTAGAVKVRIT
jgi:hypothetical protein